MTFKNIVFCLCAVTALSACETMNKPQKQTTSAPEIVELPQNPTKSRYDLPPGMITNDMETASLMSNPNVIVFPVDGDISHERRTFPEYRGVIENTTAGGYTVMDPSVTVFAVDDVGTRPEYLPEYSVPRYAEQLYPQQMAAYTPQPMLPAQTVTAAPVPLSMEPVVMEPMETFPQPVSIAPGIQAEPLPRPPRMTEAGRVSMPVDRPRAAVLPTDNTMSSASPATRNQTQAQPQQRRSRPVLTGY